MGLFGGKSEDELRAAGTPTTARVTYVDDSGKRRDGGAMAKVKVRVQLESGAARGREMEKDKWVPADRLPRVGEHVQIRYDPDHVGDWAWGDAAMYEPARTAPAAPATTQPSGGPAEIQQIVSTAFAGDFGINQTSRVIDLTGNPELREQILGQLRAYGVDIDAMQAATNSVGASAAPPAAGAPAGSVDETAVKLKQLDELLRQGILTPDEHREQRQKIIDSI